MTFELQKKGAYEPRAALKNTINISRSAKAQSFNLTISGDIVDNVFLGTSVQVLTGVGEHEGRVLIRRCNVGQPGAFKIHRKDGRHSGKMVLSRNALGLPNIKELPSTQVKFTTSDDSVVLDLRNIIKLLNK